MPEPKKPAFDKSAARSALGGAAGAAAACSDGTIRGSARVAVTFAPSGRATTAIVQGGLLAGTAVGSCVARNMRSVRIAAFDGPAVTVIKRVRVREHLRRPGPSSLPHGA